jgi:hypothetical protein
LQKKLEEEKARKFKANPYPYTTDYPVVRAKWQIYAEHILVAGHLLTYAHIFHSGATKAWTETMHEARRFSAGELGETWSGAAKANGRKREDGEGRGSEENCQGTTDTERVSSICPTYDLLRMTREEGS